MLDDVKRERRRYWIMKEEAHYGKVEKNVQTKSKTARRQNT